MKLKAIIAYGAIAAIVVIVLDFVKFKYILRDINPEVYTLILAVFFITFGVYITRTFFLKKEERLNWKINPEHDPGLSKRELEVLHELVKGRSNNEIAEVLFISLPTVKTHISNIYSKLDVQRRTQAIQKAISMNLVNPTKV